MEIKKIVEGMTAPQVAQVIDDNFKAQNAILEEDIAKQNNVIGVSEYKIFSEAEAVNAGDVRKYNGFLYECVEATTGAFDASKWKKSSFKAETEKKLSELGSYVENPEYARAYTDAEGRFLWGIKQDGSIEFAKGVPTPIKNYIVEFVIKRIDNVVVPEIETLKEAHEQYLKESENSEYIRIYTDSEGAFLWGIRKNGAIDWSVGIPTPIRKKLSEIQNSTSNNNKNIERLDDAIKELNSWFYNNGSDEYLSIETDGEGKILSAVNKDGIRIFFRGVKFGTTTIETFEDKEGRLMLILDKEGKIISSIDKYGNTTRVDYEKRDNVEGNYLWNVVERNNIGSRFDFTKVGVYDYYAAYEELARTYKDDFKIMDDIGMSTTPAGVYAEKDSNIYPIKRYQFKKKGGSATKRLILIGAAHGDSESKAEGVQYNEGDWYNNHGDAAQNILCPLFFINNLLQNPNQNEQFKNIYDNYIIDIIPIINPWGVQNHSRGNGRGVDLNRNYGYEWNTTSTYEEITTGEHAFSENETLALKNYIESDSSNIEMCIDCHARGEILIPNIGQFMYLTVNEALEKEASHYFKKNITARFDGEVAYAASNIHGTLIAWMTYTVGAKMVFTVEFGQTLNKNIYTRNSKVTNYQMTSFLECLILNLL